MKMLTATYIRRAERDDLDTVLAWMEDPDFHQFLYGEAAQSSRQTRERIIMMLGRTAGQSMPGAVYLVIDSKVDGPLGMASLQNISWRNRSCSLDVYVGAKEKRRGLTAAVSVFRVLEYCFDELNLHRVSAFIYAFNRASWRLFEKAGAQREITLTQHVKRDGQLHDAYGYGLLREEFAAVRARYVATLDGATLEDMIVQMAAAAEAP